jgi:DNA-binding GntR family transcriptional regulator
MAAEGSSDARLRRRGAAQRRRGREAAEVSLADQAYARLEEMIVRLQLAPGAVVSEQALAERLGIGRTPIREALQRLARERLITVLPRRGIMVSEVNIRTQLRLLETRREIERLLARSAALRAKDEERARFRAIADGMEAAARSNDDKAFLRLDQEFNLLVLDAAQNEFAAGAMMLMNGLSRRFWYIHYKVAADMPMAARLHAEIARAIAKGDRDKAGAAVNRLLDYIETFTRATLDAQG